MRSSLSIKKDPSLYSLWVLWGTRPGTGSPHHTLFKVSLQKLRVGLRRVVVKREDPKMEWLEIEWRVEEDDEPEHTVSRWWLGGMTTLQGTRTHANVPFRTPSVTLSSTTWEDPCILVKPWTLSPPLSSPLSSLCRLSSLSKLESWITSFVNYVTTIPFLVSRVPFPVSVIPRSTILSSSSPDRSPPVVTYLVINSFS